MLEIILALIPTAGMVVVAILQKGHSHKLNAIRDQVQNDHANTTHPNLRDDLDAKFKGLEIQMKISNDIQHSHGRELKGLREDVAGLRDADRELRSDIENTRPRPPLTKPKDPRP